MPPHIIRNRLTKALHVSSSAYRQSVRAKAAKRRGTYRNGVVAYPETIHVRTTTEQLARVERLCQALRLERAIVFRDALEVYLTIAEAEFAENNELPDLTPVVRKPRKRKSPTS